MGDFSGLNLPPKCRLQLLHGCHLELVQCLLLLLLVLGNRPELEEKEEEEEEKEEKDPRQKADMSKFQRSKMSSTHGGC